MSDGDRRGDAPATRTAGRLWCIGGVLVLVASLAGPARLDDPVVLFSVGLGAVAVGLVHLGLARAGGGSPAMLLATTSLGTVAITVVAIAAGSSDVAVAALYGFVALMGALHFDLRAQAVLLAGVAVGAGVLVMTGTPVQELVIVLAVSIGGALVAGRQTASLRAANERLAAQEAWRSAVQGSLAHDVRSPLAAIDGTLDALLQRDGELDPGRRRELLIVARRQAARVERLAADLLDAERVQDGQLRLERTDVSVAELFARVAALTPDVARDDGTPDLVLHVDPMRIEQVLHNLVTNAQKYGAPPLQLEARRANDGGVVLTVRDHGPGVPPAVEERLFARFAADPRGVGLGLWIVRCLVEAHGGEVVLVPVHPGARFEVRLPADAVADGPYVEGGGGDGSP